MQFKLETRNASIAINSDYKQQFDWIFPVASNVVLSVATTWILISLIHFGIKTGKWRKSRSKVDVLNAGFVYSSVVMCGFMCLFRYVISLVFMNIGFQKNEDELCDSIADAAYCSYAFVLCFVALFLWFRQRAFYSNSLLNVNYNKLVSFFSFASIIFILAYGLFVIALNTAPNSYSSSTDGCTLKPDRGIVAGYWISVIVGVAFYNLVLWGLLIYALTHVRSFQKATKRTPSTNTDSPTRDSSCINNQDKEQSEKEHRPESTDLESQNNHFRSRRKHSSMKIKIILQKTLIFGIISILSDIFIQIFANFIVNPDGHRRFTYMLFDINAFLNLLFLVFSFVSYKEMLTSPCSTRTRA